MARPIMRAFCWVPLLVVLLASVSSAEMVTRRWGTPPAGTLASTNRPPHFGLASPATIASSRTTKSTHLLRAPRASSRFVSSLSWCAT